MQALGNDFVLIQESHLASPLTSSHIRWIAHRRQGIGCDQVILIKNVPDADAHLSFYNADGTEASACGNGTRCVAKYLDKESGLIQTPSFVSHFWKKEDKITISLKTPLFSPPLLLPLGKAYPVDVGNPHLVIFTHNLELVPLEKLALTLQPPEGVNIEIAQVMSPTHIKVKVWERGVGFTPACGSGACAVGSVSLKLGLIEKSPVLIEMEGGLLEMEWTEGNPLLLTGSAAYCFEGIIDLP
jgi:diaminopimelate epimerase